jgi:hypothetical protein
MPSVILSHRGDPLGTWCRANIERIFSGATIERARPLLEADNSLVSGTALVEAAGCPDEILRGRTGPREVWTCEDLEPLVAHLTQLPDSTAEVATAKVLAAFWEAAAEEGQAQAWVWPYDRVALERQIEDWLEANLHELATFGLNVRVAQPTAGTSGRQWRSLDGTNRLDLLLETTEDGPTTVDGLDGDEELEFRAGDLVVVELKAVPLSRDSVQQVRRYMRAVEEEVANERMVWGLLIGAGADSSFYDELDADDDPIMMLFLSQIGFTRQFLGDLVDPPTAAP